MRLFGTDGVRGIVNKDLDIFLATKIGVSAAYVLGKNKKIKVSDIDVEKIRNMLLEGKFEY